ncbi:MAG: hypothetical protein ACUVX8_01850 [Candidatus Zipacnadales bacterium]
MVRRVLCIPPLLLATLGCGCAKRPIEEPSTPDRPTVRILAYINVSSGCQEPTLELLRSFPRQYPNRVYLNIVNFGDQGAGNRQWKASGYDCMTIEINGSDIVRFPVDGKEKVVAFRQPVGFWWTHEDLQAAVAAGIAGKLGTGTEEEALASRPRQKITAEIVVEEVKRGEKTYARVLINERPAMTIQTSRGGQSPVKRAEAAAQVLREWLSKPVAPNQIDRQKTAGGWAVRVNKKVVEIATASDAKAANGTPDALAKKWLVGIRQGIALAARPEGISDAPTKAEPQEGDCETGG